MKNPKRREMFSDLYRLAEYYEEPPFEDGNIDRNAQFFADAAKTILMPFLEKWQNDKLAADLAFDVIEEASEKAKRANERMVFE